MKFTYYFPLGKLKKFEWCNNLSTQLAIEGPKMNESAADIAAVQADCRGIVELNQQVEEARANLARLIASRTDFEESAGKRLRDYVKRVKTNPLYTPAIGRSLGILNTITAEDMTNVKLALKAVVTGRHVRISFGRKKNLHAVNIYCRIGGTGEFTLLATVTKSPYADERPPAVAGVMELREYYGMPVYNNKEVGQPGEIIAVNFRG